ncbi:hypothetical protein [Virgibacillus sp. YIM 98842]|uniref:hypothetical protein n=1 Tax=Virgibacillus sp. YIM 98842 TaxID=2663533 RepID=UPI0013DA2C7E|nr:hypothetical protein [Virgibacillus sp. YIM 98842]
MSVWVHERKEVHETAVSKVLLNLMLYDENFRRIRKRDKACKLCRKPFKNMDSLHVGFTDKGNKLMCWTCADKAIEHGVECFDYLKKRWINKGESE